MADGDGCTCGAYCSAECCCAADWTPQELIDARAEIARLRGDAEVARLRLEAAQEETERLRDELASATRHMEMAEAAWLRETAGNSPVSVLLTDEEREAVECAAQFFELRPSGRVGIALRSLLERLS